jgi:hypothetical protein
MNELYSHSTYRGYHLFVECIELDYYHTRYEGVAQLNGTTIFTSAGMSGDIAEDRLKMQIDKEDV